MTGPEFTKAVAEYELHEPVTVEDCRAIFNDLRPRIPVGISLDVVIYADAKRVDVTLYANGARETRSIAVQS